MVIERLDQPGRLVLEGFMDGQSQLSRYTPI
jgi:hypothetical protein